MSLLFTALVMLDFRMAEYIYDNILFGMLMSNEKIFHEFFKVLHNFMEKSVYAFLRACRDITFSFISGIIPNLPNPIRYPLEMMGIPEYLEKSVNRSLDERKKKEKEYMEYAKKIEKNRPVPSPSAKKAEKITFQKAQDEKPKAPETKKVYDPQTKQFKYVTVDPTQSDDNN